MKRGKGESRIGNTKLVILPAFERREVGSDAQVRIDEDASQVEESFGFQCGWGPRLKRALLAYCLRTVSSSALCCKAF